MTLLIIALLLLAALLFIRLLIPLGIALFVPINSRVVDHLVSFAKINPGEKIKTGAETGSKSNFFNEFYLYTKS